jgi:hypothetical protein
MKNQTQKPVTLVKGFITENVYDYLNTGNLDPIEVKVPYRIYRTGNYYQWEANTPTGTITSPKFTDYDKCLGDWEDFK